MEGIKDSRTLKVRPKYKELDLYKERKAERRSKIEINRFKKR